VADALQARGVAYVPDFVANAGALIRGGWAHLRGTPGTDAEIAAIRGRTRELLGRAQATGICALRLALHDIQLQLPETG
jgi:glutamate dehydrogenase/leucine dehydrogenase